MSEDELIALFSKSGKAEKTPRNANPNLANSANVTNNNNDSQSTIKSKNKKKKGKK
jgi:hypothetical protein